VIVIPARLASTRLPRKLLLDRTGKSVLQHTFEQASRSKLADRVVVACDDDQIVADVTRFGGDAVMTRPDHVCGTDRIAEVAASLDADLIVNVQGDEPEIEPESIDLAIRLLTQNIDLAAATLATPIRSRKALDDPANVKVVFDGEDRAMYFSRSPIPHPRTWHDELLGPPADHVGLYVYRKEFLLHISKRPAVQLEQIESLEQLRFLHGGHQVIVGKVEHSAPGIDTLADYEAFVSRAKKR
ncbi:UNVERIFIED_CONTAM: hypothetical protein GTU68_003878, partial [Idotea baltica]|nr:hypothetical protein [Idotea baltica]